MLFSSLLISINASATASKNLVLVTIDGFRWQELFTGADPSLLNNQKFVRADRHVKEKFWHDNETKRRELLMPFFLADHRQKRYGYWQS